MVLPGGDILHEGEKKRKYVKCKQWFSSMLLEKSKHLLTSRIEKNDN
jgi:hypothetical protein